MPNRDDVALDDLCDRLRATGAFGEVFLGSEPGMQAAPAEATTCAWIWRNQTREDTRFGPADALRTVEFLLYLAAVDDDPAERLRMLARMEAVAVDAFEGQSLGGFTCPALSRFDRGKDQYAKHPQSLYQVKGEFTYLPNDGSAGSPAAREEGDRSGGSTSDAPATPPAAAAGGYGGSAGIGTGYGDGGYGL